MEPKPKTPSPAIRDEEHVDLGNLIYKTSGFISSIGPGISRAFDRINNGIGNSLVFLRKNLIWLAIGTAAAVGYEVFVQTKNGTRFSDEMIVRTNFNSTRALYNSMDFFNSLISSRQTNKLSSIFEITPEEAASLKHFSASPIESEMIVAEMYKEQFLTLERNTRYRMDTFWIKTIKYEDFKNSLTQFDYPLHKITVVSSNQQVFRKLQEGVVGQISDNKLLQEIRKTEEKANNDAVNLLTSSIQSLDTLRRTYNLRLQKGDKTVPPSNNVTLLDGNSHNRIPELELYDKLLELKDELKQARTQATLESNILQVYTPFNPTGQRESFLKINILYYALFGFLCTLALLIIIWFYKRIGDLERKRMALK